jgi:uncharacterized membrane protein YhaH (DUF805 family)
MSVANYFFGWSGRIGRLHWWLGGLVQAVIVAVACILFVSGAGIRNPALIVLGIPFVFIAVWFGVCLSIKRLHDHDKSGFWFFIYFIPIVGAIWQLIECGLLRGTDGDNDYGPDPRFRFNVSEDIDALFAQRDREATSRQRTAMPQAPVAASVSLAPAAVARPVFGKRA